VRCHNNNAKQTSSRWPYCNLHQLGGDHLSRYGLDLSSPYCIDKDRKQRGWKAAKVLCDVITNGQTLEPYTVPAVIL
jgi:hypothetical protein